MELDLKFDNRSSRCTERECEDCCQPFTPIGRERVCPYCRAQERDAEHDRERSL
jgi:Zn finger protein HypA/HybF involved in hydrogenase expression